MCVRACARRHARTHVCKSLKSTSTHHSSIKTNMWVNQQESILASPECPGTVHSKVLEKAVADGSGTKLFQPEMQQDNQTHVKALLQST